MRLAEWFEQRNADGSKRLKYRFAERINRTPSMVTDYCEDRAWPDRETMEAIVRETGGAVTANDFLRPEAVQ